MAVKSEALYKYIINKKNPVQYVLHDNGLCRKNNDCLCINEKNQLQNNGNFNEIYFFTNIA